MSNWDAGAEFIHEFAKTNLRSLNLEFRVLHILAYLTYRIKTEKKRSWNGLLIKIAARSDFPIANSWNGEVPSGKVGESAEGLSVYFW